MSMSSRVRFRLFVACFSSHFCFLVILVLLILVLFLVAVINLSLLFFLHSSGRLNDIQMLYSMLVKSSSSFFPLHI